MDAAVSDGRKLSMGRKSKKKSGFWSATGLIVVAAVVFVFWRAFYNNPKTVTQPVAPDNVTTVLETPAPKDNPGDKQLYTAAALNSDIKSTLVAKLMQTSSTYKEMLQTSDFPAEQNSDSVKELATDTVNGNSFAFDYNARRYIVTNDFSGGSHCCYNWYVFTLDAQNNLVEIKPDHPIATMGNFPPVNADTNLTQKNGQLYLVLSDDRFAYYCGSYDYTPFLERYFLITPQGLTLKNGDFADVFQKEAAEADAALQKYSGVGVTADAPEKKCQYLVARTADYVLAGLSDKAWADFDAGVAKLAPVAPYNTAQKRYGTAAEMKKNIADLLNQ